MYFVLESVEIETVNLTQLIGQKLKLSLPWQFFFRTVVKYHSFHRSGHPFAVIAAERQ